MSSTTIYHYAYRISNRLTGMHYYGVRTSKVHPKLDLGLKYFSSSSDKNFIKEQKTQPQNFRYKILRCFDTRKEASNREIELHAKFDVGVNPKFYNRCKAISTGFGRHGVKTSDETKKKNSIANKGRVKSEETKERISISNASTDHRIHTFYHKSGEIFIGKQKEFREKYPLSKAGVSMLVSSKQKTTGGWRIS